MSDEKTEAVDKIAEFVKMAIKGWPIYGIVIGLMWSYSELWLDAKIANAIKTQTVEQPAMVQLTGAVNANTNAINNNTTELGLVRQEVNVVEEDTKAILRMMAGE